MHPRAGTIARPGDLVDIDALLAAYDDIHPDPGDPAQQVVFGTSGHRGSSLDGAFNADHIAAITQAICDFRAAHGIDGPLFIGADTHALSAPALDTALEVLAGNAVRTRADLPGAFTPTPAVSHAIVTHNRNGIAGRADGIVLTPSHNPPRDGGIKYNPPHGGPADSGTTAWIADRANRHLENHLHDVVWAAPAPETFDFRSRYVENLTRIINLAAIRGAGVRIGADPLGGASVAYWPAIAERYGLDLTVTNDTVDPQFAFMPLDRDGKIRMDCSSPQAMATLLAHADTFDIATGNDADADRHGIVTGDAGLMNPNHYLAAMIDYLLDHRAGWPASAAIGKTVVTSSLIDRIVADRGRALTEVPVGFKYFVDGLAAGSVAFAGEESAGASFLRSDGLTWTTDKDGIVANLLAAEITAVAGRSPSMLYAELAERYGTSSYARTDAPATREQKRHLAALTPADITTGDLAGERIEAVLTTAPGNGEPLGGIKVVTANAWFAARPSGTEDVYKIYAESFRGPDHLAAVQQQAQELVDAVLAGG